MLYQYGRFGWYCVFVQQLEQLYCNDDVGLFAIGTARLKTQHLQHLATNDADHAT